MGRLIEFPRRPVEDVGVQAGHSHAATEATAPHLPAVPDPLEGEVLPAVPKQRPAPDKRLHRPEWLGVGPRARAAARTAAWLAVCRVCGRSWWELWCGTPTRIWHLTRWFLRGMVGWIELARWCFAVDERSDIRRPAPGSLRGTPPGRAAQVGSKVDATWKLRLGFVTAVNVGGWLAVWHWVPPPVEYLPWITSAKVAWICWGLPWIVGTTVYGWYHDEAPPEPVVAPRDREDVNVTAMNDALRSVGILAKPTANDPTPDGCRLAAAPKSTRNAGQETVFDLPASCGKATADVIAQRDRLAGAFATPRNRFYIEAGAHEAQFKVWTSARDPFAGNAPEHPLMRVSQWNVWDRYPFAHDVRGDYAYYSVPLTSDLTGSRPRRGKSYAVRSKLVGAVLDETVRFVVLDAKGGMTWGAPPDPEVPDAPRGTGLYPIADTFIEGCGDEETRQATEEVERLAADIQVRQRRIRGSVITREASRDPKVDCPITVIIIDEAQEYLEHPKYGKRFEAGVTSLAKRGPSAGYAPFILTQRPDSDTFASKLKGMLGSRLALQVMTYDDSNVILGRDMSKLGHDASKLPKRGIGIYRPDDEAEDGTAGPDGVPDDPGTIRTVRIFDMSDEVWEAICERGLELRDGPRPETVDTPEIAGPKGLMALTVDALREQDCMSATGLLGALPEPWSELSASVLGQHLQRLGLTSRHRRTGNFYHLEDATIALRKVRHDPSTPLSPVKDGDGLVEDREAPGDGAGETHTTED